MDTLNWHAYPRVAQHAVARAFLESLVKRRKQPKTLDAYARNLDHFLHVYATLDPHHPVVEAQIDEIEAYLGYLATCPSQRRDKRRRTPPPPLTDATIRQRLVTLRRFYEFCLDRDLRQHPRNPVPRGHHGVQPQLSLVPLKEDLPWIPSDQQWAEIVADLQQHESPRNRALFLLAYDSGLRRQEVLSLRLRDVNWSEGTVFIRRETAKRGSQRTVPFSLATEALLQHYVFGDRQTLLDGWGGDAGGPLFLSESHRNSGQPLRIGALNDIVDRIRGRLALPYLHPHTLRHLRCTVLKRCGLSLAEIALFAGHQSTLTTEKYIHLAPQELCQRIRQATAPFDARMERLINEHRRE